MPNEVRGFFIDMKETKRKAFQFYRSYYDVFNELNDADKLSFIKALFDKEFLDIEPEELGGMAKFAWISQYNSIDQQVKGYKSKSKDPMQGGSARGVEYPTQQEEEKEEEKEEGEYTLKAKDKFLTWFNIRRTEYLKKPSHCNILSPTDRTNLNLLKTNYSEENFEMAMKGFCNDEFYLSKNLILPNHFLKPENFVKFLNAKTTINETMQERASRLTKEQNQ